MLLRNIRLIYSRFRITEERGIWFKDTRYAPFAMATFNPAYVLRQEGENHTTLRSTIIDDIGEAKRKLDEAKDIPKSTLF